MQGRRDRDLISKDGENNFEEVVKYATYTYREITR